MRLSLIILILFFSIFKNSYIQANDKVAFIDLNYILQESVTGKKILDNLKNTNDKNLQKFKLDEKELSKEHEEIKKMQNVISINEYNKKLTSFQNKLDIYNEKKTKIIKSFEQFKDKQLNNFFNDLNKIMSQYMKDNSIIIIFDKKNIIMADKQNDISKEILKIVNTNE